MRQKLLFLVVIIIVFYQRIPAFACGWLLCRFRLVNCCVLQHFPLPCPIPPHYTFNCCVFSQTKPPKLCIIRYRPSEGAKRRIRPKVEFVIPAGDVIRGIGKAAAREAGGKAQLRRVLPAGSGETLNIKRKRERRQLRTQWEIVFVRLRVKRAQLLTFWPLKNEHKNNTVVSTRSTSCDKNRDDARATRGGTQ